MLGLYRPDSYRSEEETLGKTCPDAGLIALQKSPESMAPGSTGRCPREPAFYPNRRRRAHVVIAVKDFSHGGD